jgi:hypothetical protein
MFCFFRTTQELYLFFCHAQRKFFFQNLTLGYITDPLLIKAQRLVRNSPIFMLILRET